ncbi:uncharacterized protein LOC123547644 [Mercenaria mercenaria]|uniref:uncharacterized protein LOC123547644 n=1 Tax=Mercenaria mercenaria TaxID=6596 RepID=UPI00234F073C|nr:uncharacterized protein LOC123547644 [Mercenaria mercenaria]
MINADTIYTEDGDINGGDNDDDDNDKNTMMRMNSTVMDSTRTEEAGASEKSIETCKKDDRKIEQNPVQTSSSTVMDSTRTEEAGASEKSIETCKKDDRKIEQNPVQTLSSTVMDSTRTEEAGASEKSIETCKKDDRKIERNPVQTSSFTDMDSTRTEDSGASSEESVSKDVVQTSSVTGRDKETMEEDEESSEDESGMSEDEDMIASCRDFCASAVADALKAVNALEAKVNSSEETNLIRTNSLKVDINNIKTHFTVTENERKKEQEEIKVLKEELCQVRRLATESEMTKQLQAVKDDEIETRLTNLENVNIGTLINDKVTSAFKSFVQAGVGGLTGVTNTYFFAINPADLDVSNTYNEGNTENEVDMPSNEQRMTDIPSKLDENSESEEEVEETELEEMEEMTEEEHKRTTHEESLFIDQFPLRRSKRKISIEMQNQKYKDLLKKIVTGCEDGLMMVHTENKGRGVIATKKFQHGDFVVEYSGDLIGIKEAKLRNAEYSKDPSKGCYMYFFEFENKKYCIDATAESGKLGRLLNHSKTNRNCHPKLVNDKGKPYLIIVASRDINEGEELLYDYGDRCKTSIKYHPWLKY